MGQYFDNEKIPSNMKRKDIVLLGTKFSFLTDNGVFSKDNLDFGSRLLLESIPMGEVGGKILDVGCGYGVFGIIINKFTKAEVDMVDVNLRAIHLTNMNIKNNKCENCRVFESNCYDNVKGKYNVIVTNPPIRAGKTVVYEIVIGAKKFLEDNGKLFIVIRKEQGAKSMMKKLDEYYTVKVLAKEKGFYILECSV